MTITRIKPNLEFCGKCKHFAQGYDEKCLLLYCYGKPMGRRAVKGKPARIFHTFDVPGKCPYRLEFVVGDITAGDTQTSHPHTISEPAPE